MYFFVHETKYIFKYSCREPHITIYLSINHISVCCYSCASSFLMSSYSKWQHHHRKMSLLQRANCPTVQGARHPSIHHHQLLTRAYTGRTRRSDWISRKAWSIFLIPRRFVSLPALDGDKCVLHPVGPTRRLPHRWIIELVELYRKHRGIELCSKSIIFMSDQLIVSR